MNRNQWIHTAVVLILVCTTGWANAAVIVKFDNDPPIASTVSARIADTNAIDGDVWNFSDELALVDASSLEAAGNSNLRVYGGIKTSWDSGSNYAPNIRVVSFNNLFQLQVDKGNTTDAYEGILVWNQADFLNGADVQTITFDGTSSMSIDLLTHTGGSFRFVVNDGGTYYVSEFSGSGTALNTLNNPGAANWTTINTSDYSFESENFGSHSFEDIQGVGVYVEATVNGNQALFNMTDFEVNAAVPEPAALGLVSVGAAVMMLIRRHLNRR